MLVAKTPYFYGGQTDRVDIYNRVHSLQDSVISWSSGSLEPFRGFVNLLFLVGVSTVSRMTILSSLPRAVSNDGQSTIVGSLRS